MTATNRTRQLEWINTFGRNALRDAVYEILAMDGDEFLNDEQIRQVAEKMAIDAREATRRQVRRRNANREHAGLPPLIKGAA